MVDEPEDFIRSLYSLMASATMLLRRSVISGGNQVYCRYLSAAAKRSHINVVPASVPLFRRFASSTAPKYNEAFVNDLLSKVHVLEGDIESLRKQKELLLQSKEEAVGSVKQKHPLLKEIELEISKNRFSGKKAKKLINGFKIVRERDSCWLFPDRNILLEGSFVDDKISLELSKPISKQMQLRIQVVSSGIMAEKVEFFCTVTAKGSYEIQKVKYGFLPFFRKDLAFDQLPENVQREIHTYLELRGIDSNTTDSLYEYMLDKICKKHLKGLHQKFQYMV